MASPLNLKSSGFTEWLIKKGVTVDDDIAQKIQEKGITIENAFELDWDDNMLKEIGIQSDGLRKLCLIFINEQRHILEQKQSKIFHDPIHGSMEMHPLLLLIINTPQFQRLRDIKQLGGVYFVYPGASHNRFEHSIGVCYLAGEFLKNLRKYQPELNIKDKDVLCVKIAALCHDMGHGPFSHLYQDHFIPHYLGNERKWKHEETSVDLMNHMVEVNELKMEFKKYGIEWDSDKKFIADCIHGKKPEELTTKNDRMPFLYEIVANKAYEVDVDKMDYLLRDAHALGMKADFDWERYMKLARVITCRDGKQHICPPEKEARNVYQLFSIRDRLFRAAYKHKTARAVEFMLSDLLKEANDHILIPGKNGCVKMSAAIDDMEAFTNLTDSVVNAMLFHSEANEKAKNILKRIHQRKLYMFVDYSLLSDYLQKPNRELEPTQESIFSRCFEKLDESEKGKFRKEDIIVDKVKFSWGFGECNPVEKMYFYDKSSPNTARPLSREHVSVITPNTFEESQIRLYYKGYSQKVRNIMKDVFKTIRKETPEELPGPHKDSDDDSQDENSGGQILRSNTT